MSKATGGAAALAKIRAKVQRAAISALKYTFRELMKDLRKRLTGGAIKKKSGALLSSFKLEPPTLASDILVEGKVRFDPQKNPMGVSTARYWKTHFGPAGSKQFISPVNCKWLTIPTKQALGKNGYPRGPARSPIWGPTTVHNYLIWGMPGYKGPGSSLKSGTGGGGAGGGFIPLWILRQRVSVPRRIDPKELAQNARITFAFEFGKRMGRI